MFGVFAVLVTALLTVSMMGVFVSGVFGTVLFAVGSVLHALALFGFAFSLCSLFSTATAASRAALILSLLLFVAYMVTASAILGNGVAYSASPLVVYLLCLIEPLCFGHFLQKVFCTLILSF